MTNTKQFLSETVHTASFALREYFRPIVVAARLFRSSVTRLEHVEYRPDNPVNLEAAKAILRERLVEGRHHEKILLVQGVVSAIASLLALAISLMHEFNVEFPLTLAILAPLSIFALWVVIRLVKQRENIVQAKTIRWMLKSLDQETAERVAKQITWGKRLPRRHSKPHRKAH